MGGFFYNSLFRLFLSFACPKERNKEKGSRQTKLPVADEGISTRLLWYCGEEQWCFDVSISSFNPINPTKSQFRQMSGSLWFDSCLSPALETRREENLYEGVKKWNTVTEAQTKNPMFLSMHWPLVIFQSLSLFHFSPQYKFLAFFLQPWFFVSFLSRKKKSKT